MSLVSKEGKNRLNKTISAVLLAAIVFVAGGFTAVEQALAAASIFTNQYRITYNGAGNANVDAALDAFSNVHAVYERGGSIYYKQKRGTEEPIATGTNPAIAVDSTGAPYVTYLDGGKVKLVSKTIAGWQAAVEIGDGTQADIDVDASDKVHIAFISAGADGYADLLYVNNASGAFNLAAPTVIEDGRMDGVIAKTFSDPSIKIDQLGFYHIAYLATEFTGDAVSSAKYVQTKSNGLGTAVSPNMGYNSTGILGRNALALDETGASYVVYTGNISSIYRGKVTADAAWEIATVTAGGGSNPSIAYKNSVDAVTYTSTGNIRYKEDAGAGFGSADMPMVSADNSVLLMGANTYVYGIKSGDVYLATTDTLVDSNPPVISGVTEGATYAAAVTITFSDLEGGVTGDLDGAVFVSGHSVNTDGLHTITVTDDAGNTAVVHFTINLPAPTLGHIYRISYDPANDINVDAAADAFGNIHAVYERGGSVYYKLNRGVEELVAAGTNPAIAVDSFSAPQVTFISSGALIKFVNKTVAGWQTAIDIGAGTQADVAVDAADKVHIVYDQTGADGYHDLLYVNNSTGSFNLAAPTVVKDGRLDGAIERNYTDASIKADASGFYHIAYLATEYTGDPVSSAKYYEIATNSLDGNSISPNLGYNSIGIVGRNALALNSSAHAFVAYVANVSSVYQAKITGNTIWNVVTVANGGASNPALDVSGAFVGVAYTSAGNVVYKEDSGAGFGSAATIDTSADKAAVALAANKYVYYEKSGDIYLATDKVIIDTNPPIVSGVTEGATYVAPVTITFSDQEGPATATLNGLPCNSGSIISANAAYTLIVTDAAGNTTTVHFTMNIGGPVDTTAPVVTGVTDGQTYTAPVTITITDDSGAFTATLNGVAFTSGSTVSANGTYVLVASDAAANTTTVHFVINISVTPPPPPPGGGGGGGGGNSYDPTIYAYNVPLRVCPTVPAVLTWNFADGSTAVFRIPVGAASECATFRAAQLTLAKEYLPKDANAVVVNGKAYQLFAENDAKAPVSKMLKPLNIAITIPALISNTTTAYPYMYAPGEWVIQTDVTRDDAIGKVSFTANTTGNFAIIKTTLDNKSPLKVNGATGEIVPPEPPEGEVLGVTHYEDGSLLRAPNHRIYFIIDGKKKIILCLAELQKYAGQEIIDVSYEEIAQYPDYNKKTIPRPLPAYGDGDLVRGRCQPKVYVIKSNKKLHIKTLLELAEKYLGREIHNVSMDVVNYYDDYGVETSQTYTYTCSTCQNDGMLIRGTDHKVYVIKDGRKYWVKTLDELAQKYLGQQILAVSDEVIAGYLDY